MGDELTADATLVRQALAGNAGAFEQLVRRHERSVRTVCWHVLQDHHLAGDAAQEAFVDAFRALAGLKDPAAFGGWVATTARRRALRMATQRRPAAPLPDLPADTAEDDGELLALIAALPDQERQVVLLRFFDGYESSQIAAILQRPLGTVTKQLSRAYERLRAAIREELQQ